MIPGPRLDPYWRMHNLQALRDDFASGLSLVECAARQPGEVHALDCDLALWALAGRSVLEACNHLNGRLAA